MPHKEQKYFFDLNNFDGPAIPEPEENLPPPPPTFSEDEIEAAKAQGFEDGRIIGREEEQHSRNQYIATQISELNTQVLGLILAEQIREKRFENEVIHLCRALTSRLFPMLTAKEGYKEIENIIAKIVQNQPLSHIKIEVPTDDADDIKSHLACMKDIHMERLTIISNTDLSKGHCRMKWEDGGAIRDHQALSAAIFKELDEVLAPPPQTSHNSESETRDSALIDATGDNHGEP